MGGRGAQTIAEILLGKINPSGRLPISFPRFSGATPCSYSMLAGGAPEDGGTAPAGQCGVAVFSILAQEDDGAYTVALTRFLTLGS